MAIYSFREWVRQVASEINVVNVQHVCPPDVRPYVTGYMVALCDLVDDQPLVAQSVTCDSWDKVMQYLADAARDNEVYLYRIIEISSTAPNSAGSMATYFVRHALRSKLVSVELVP